MKKPKDEKELYAKKSSLLSRALAEADRMDAEDAKKAKADKQQKREQGEKKQKGDAEAVLSD